MRRSNLILGMGIGSVPFGSFHRFVLSRIYETGIIGLVFTGFVTAMPFWLLFQRTTDSRARDINRVCVGGMSAAVFGLHAYDFFVHLWPWTVIGAMMSFYNSESASARLQERNDRTSKNEVVS